MNFETLNKQRKLVLIAAVCGIICMFLPWWKIELDYGYGMASKQSGNGMAGWGVVVFITLLISGGMALMGDQTKTLHRTNWMIVLIVSAIANLIMLIMFFNSTSNLGVVQFGYYGAWSACIGVLVFAYNNRAADDSLANGFDSLKESIGSKASATKGGN